MRTRFARVLVVALATAALGAGLSSPAHADLIYVGPGDSIQAAVDAAARGDTIVVAPGTFHEQVQVSTDGLTLQGAGNSPEGTVLLPPEEPVEDGCSFGEPDFTTGICVVGDFEAMTPVTGVTIRGFHVEGFSFNGIAAFLAEDTVLDHNTTSNNGEYGVFVNSSVGTMISGSVASGNPDAGFYVGDSPNAAAHLVGNRAYGNGWGFFARDASNGSMEDNTAYDNCIGMFFLDTYSGASNWRASNNNASHNTRFCPPAEGPPLSGVGIFIFGMDGVSLRENVIERNRPSGPTVTAGGIVIQSSAFVGGSDANGARVQDNSLANNRRGDIVWDRTGTDNRFRDNDCLTSKPAGICEREA